MSNHQSAKALSLPPSRAVEMKLGSYHPCFEIGSGGMASVYIAREIGISGLQRTVALKVMHEHLARLDEFKKRFLDEARVLTHINHPYVCRVVGFGEEAGRPFMAMEYLVGEPLSRILRAMKRRAVELPTARRARLFARVIADLAEGLHAAHETQDTTGKLMGVVHRDVTPQNLFLLYDGTVRVLDFGIARFRARHVFTATTGRLIGKLPYMAPEQVMSEPYDRRVDVWALGVVLWELVSLGRLFKRETEMRTMEAVCSERIPLVSEFTPDVPPGLDAILARALERNPTLRYATARDFSRELELWLSRTGDPVTHGDLSEFLNGFFPGSQLERRRWAEEATPASGLRAIDDQDVEEVNDDEEEEDNPTQTLDRADRRMLERDEALEPSPLGAAAPAFFPALPPPRISSSTPVEANTDPVVLLGEPATPLQRRGLWLLGLPAVLLFVGVAAFLVTPFVQRDATRNDIPVEIEPAGPATRHIEPMVAEPVPEAERSELERSEPVELDSLPIDLDDELPAARPRRNERPQSTAPLPAPHPVAAESPSPSSAELPNTGDLLIVSRQSGLRVFLGQRLLGTTPVKARLPAGNLILDIQMVGQERKLPVRAEVTAGRLEILTVNLGS